MRVQDLQKKQIQLMRLVLRGAVCCFDDQGADTIRFLIDQKKEYLIDRLNMLGTALMWLDSQLEALTDQIKDKP